MQRALRRLTKMDSAHFNALDSWDRLRKAGDAPHENDKPMKNIKLSASNFRFLESYTTSVMDRMLTDLLRGVVNVRAYSRKFVWLTTENEVY